MARLEFCSKYGEPIIEAIPMVTHTCPYCHCICSSMDVRSLCQACEECRLYWNELSVYTEAEEFE